MLREPVSSYSLTSHTGIPALFQFGVDGDSAVDPNFMILWFLQPTLGLPSKVSIHTGPCTPSYLTKPRSTSRKSRCGSHMQAFWSVSSLSITRKRRSDPLKLWSITMIRRILRVLRFGLRGGTTTEMTISRRTVQRMRLNWLNKLSNSNGSLRKQALTC
jgi:hypothetical protein